MWGEKWTGFSLNSSHSSMGSHKKWHVRAYSGCLFGVLIGLYEN